VLFEIGRAAPTDIAAVLGRLPGTRLIGLSAAGDAITVYSASERPVLSSEELTRAITEDYVACTADERRKDHA
jgi:hypothetical protein